jgi:hypothetical protein
MTPRVMLSHLSRKNKYAARVGHPELHSICKNALRFGFGAQSLWRYGTVAHVIVGRHGVAAQQGYA